MGSHPTLDRPQLAADRPSTGSTPSAGHLQTRCPATTSDWPPTSRSGFGGDLAPATATTTPAWPPSHPHPHRARDAGRDAEQAFDRLNPDFGVPADRTDRIGHRDVAQREAALALGVRVAVHDSRQNDRNPVIWQPGQDYRMADAIQAARTQPTRTRRGPERLGPER